MHLASYHKNFELVAVSKTTALNPILQIHFFNHFDTSKPTKKTTTETASNGEC